VVYYDPQRVISCRDGLLELRNRRTAAATVVERRTRCGTEK
jgi:hypothetical protein